MRSQREELGADASLIALCRKGPSPTAFEGMMLGMGQAVTVENWVCFNGASFSLTAHRFARPTALLISSLAQTFSAMGPKRDGSVTIDPKGLKCWMDPSAEENGSKWGWKRDPGWTLGTCGEPSLLFPPSFLSRC